MKRKCKFEQCSGRLDLLQYCRNRGTEIADTTELRVLQKLCCHRRHHKFTDKASRLLPRSSVINQ